MKHTKFIGTGVALITPFKKGKVDFPAIETIIDHVIDGGVEYVVMLGSTGETATLNPQESRDILDCAIVKVAKRVPIVTGNFAGNNTLELVKDIDSFDFSGIDAILSSSPAYVKPSQEGIYRHYMALEEVSPVPIIIYNVPGRTGSNITWQTTVRLAEASEKFIGVKEATGDLIQTTRIVKHKPKDFFVASGDDEVLIPMISVGGSGVISVIANALPREFSDMVRLALQDEYQGARELNDHIYDLHKWLYIEGNPVGIKTAMEILGFCSNEVRLPLHEMSIENYKSLEHTLRVILG
ncbi:MAG: 4-hydroxy-tetrahydrodipicolinate synthase [Saprospiraceae bacterium]|jgi:4-hydroxy-tetrahydrodipicolinate synthase